MIEKEGIKNGLIAGLIGSLCCVLPLAVIILAVFFGVGSATIALYFGFYGDFFVLIALIFLAISTHFYLKKKKACSINGIKTQWKTIAFSLLIMLAVYFIIKFVLVPFISGQLFGGK